MKNKTIPHLALILANSIWALDYPFYKLLMPHFVTPLEMATVAVAVAAVLSLIFSCIVGFERVERKDIPHFIAIAALTAILRKLLLMNGVARTSPIDGALIDSADPVIVFVFAVLMQQERFSLRKVVGIALCLVGTALVVLLGAHKSHEASTLSGNIMILLCAVSSAVYLVMFKNIIIKYSPLTIMRWVYCLGTVMLLPFGAKDVLHIPFDTFSTQTALLFLFVVLLPTFGPNLMLAWSLKYVSSTVSSMYGYIQPVLATFIAVALHIDKLHWDTVASSVIIFVGVYLVVRNRSGTPLSVNLKR